MNTKQLGELSEAEILLRFLRAEIPVSVPHGDNQRYDFIIDCNNKLYKIQVKTGRVSNNCVIFNTCSGIHKKYGTNSYKGQIDFFAVYCPINDKAYLVHVSKTGNRLFNLRLEAAKNNNTKLINIASEYEFENQLKLLLNSKEV